jgi:glycosyltransferase involved in cell wall biosynthesis
VGGPSEQPDNDKLRIIWPHRFHHEKGPQFAVDVIQWIGDNYRPLNCEFVFLNHPGNGEDPQLEVLVRRIGRLQYEGAPIEWINIESKDHYYYELSQATVVWSTSTEESFGYCLAEGTLLGCHPVAPACASHVEMYRHERYLYWPGDIKDCAKKLLAALDAPSPPYIYLEDYEHSFEHMLDIMEEEAE